MRIKMSDVTRRTLNILKKGLSMMRSFVRRPDSCLSAPSSSSCFLYTNDSRATLFFFFLLLAQSSLSSLRWPSSLSTVSPSLSLSVSLSFSSLQYRKEIKIVCRRRRHHCIVEEGGRHVVVLYAFSHHSFFLYVDLFLLV